MFKRYLLSALVAPLGAVSVYGLLLGLHPLSTWTETAGFLVAIAVIAYLVELLVAVPAVVALRLGLPFALPASSIMGGVLVTQFIGIPAVSFGPWGTTHSSQSGMSPISVVEVSSAALVFSAVALVKCLAFAEPRHVAEGTAPVRGLSRRQAASLLALNLLLWGAASLASRELTVYWQSPPRIEAFLLERTPLGSSEADVMRWLEARGRHATTIRASVAPNSDYPLSRTGGSAFIQETVAEYRLVFWAAVEAFYVFDTNGRLIDLRVRRTIDGP